LGRSDRKAVQYFVSLQLHKLVFMVSLQVLKVKFLALMIVEPIVKPMLQHQPLVSMVIDAGLLILHKRYFIYATCILIGEILVSSDWRCSIWNPCGLQALSL
jgi:hypothetical protein